MAVCAHDASCCCCYCCCCCCCCCFYCCCIVVVVVVVVVIVFAPVVAAAVGPTSGFAFDDTAFLKELARGKRRVSRVQLAFVGAFGAGKTNLCNNLVEPRWIEESDSTTGIEFHYSSTTMGSVDELHSDSDVGPLLTRVTKGRVACSSIAANMQQKSNDAMPGTEEQAVTEISDATQLSNRLTTDNKVRHQALREEVGTALQNPNDEKVFIDLLDCAGQLSFSVCQAISFSVDQSIFIVVYNSSIPLTEEIKSEFRKGGKHQRVAAPTMTNGHYLRLWLSTLAMLKAGSERHPTVVIVGTHSKAIDKSRADREVRALLYDFQNQLDTRREVYFVDNSEPRDFQMKNFRTELAKLVREQVNRTSQEVPLSYLSYEWYVRRYETAKYQTVGNLESFATTFAGIQSSDVPALLRYLHAHCAVRFFNYGDAVQKEATVYLNVPWLLKKVCKVLSCTMKAPGRRCPSFVVSDIDQLKEKGILTTRLADHLWSKYGAGTEVRDGILSILERLGLQCPVSSDAAKELAKLPLSAGPFYFVPICIQTEQTQLPDKYGDADTLPALVLSTDPLFFPYGEFSRLVVHLLQYYKPQFNTVEVSLCSIRFKLTDVSPCYIAEVRHVQQGVALVLKCTSPDVATGRTAGDCMAVAATRFCETVRRCMDFLRSEGCQGLEWKAAFYCAKSDGRWQRQNNRVHLLSGCSSLLCRCQET